MKSREEIYEEIRQERIKQLRENAGDDPILRPQLEQRLAEAYKRKKQATDAAQTSAIGGNDD